MSKVFLIALNTYREIIRDRILFGLVIFAVLLIGLSLALGQLSFAEQSRIALDFGLVGIQLSAVIMAIFVGSTLVSRELEKQTILTLLSKPISRSQFLLGKFFGLSGILIVIGCGLSVILTLTAILIQAPLGPQFLVGIWGIFLEAMVLLSATMLLGVLVRPFLAVSVTIGVFLIGHWINSLLFFTERSESAGFKAFGRVVSKSFPNLENFNWRALVVYQDPIPTDQVLQASLYGLAWMILILSLTSLIFRRKDFV